MSKVTPDDGITPSVLHILITLQRTIIRTNDNNTIFEIVLKYVNRLPVVLGLRELSIGIVAKALTWALIWPQTNLPSSRGSRFLQRTGTAASSQLSPK